MYLRWIVIILGTLSLLHISEGVFAEMSTEELKGKIQQCIESKNPTSITEYACVKGNMLGNKQTLTDQHTAYIVVMSIRFSEIDEEIRKEMTLLQQQRHEDPMSWVDYIETQGKLYETRYNTVCTALGGDLEVIQAWKVENNSTATTDGFPQTFCRTLAPKKAEAWKNMGYILASKGIAKNYQNAKDVHVDKVKGKYAKLLESLQGYQRVIGTAVSKLRAYISDPIGQ